MGMTESEAINELQSNIDLPFGFTVSDEVSEIAIQALEEIQQYREIGTVEEFRDLKEKNTPMELAEHNFQDEVHHYLCPSCRNIVSCNQNYCEECGQALKN